MSLETSMLPDVKSLSIQQKIAQMIMVDFSGYDIEGETLDHLSSIPWGGVILFLRNIKSREQLIELNMKIMRLNQLIPPYISVDQEGGLVNRADFPGMHLSPGNMALGKIDDESLTEEVAFISGVEQRELGFHLDFAPDVDVNINPNNPIIGVRSFGDNPGLVSRHGAASVKGFERAGLASCAKHFPGHGDTSFDSHLSLAAVEADIDRIREVEMPPFKASIDAGVPTIMTAHVIFPAVDDSRLPATLSRKILTGILRDEMGFDGLIITDSMGMKAIADYFGTGEAAVMTVKAGADIVMMCGTSESQLEAYNALVKAVENGDIPMETIDRSVKRILEFKKKYVVSPKPLQTVSVEKRGEIIRQASERSAAVLYDKKNLLPIDPTGKSVVVFSPDQLYKTLLDEYTSEWSIHPSLPDVFKSRKHVVYEIANPDVESMINTMTGECDIVFLELYSRGILNETLRRMADSVAGKGKELGIPVVFVVLSSPYGIPESADAAITGYNYLKPSLDAMVRKLLK
jgi:beta-N-acetylhexosaminidase